MKSKNNNAKLKFIAVPLLLLVIFAIASLAQTNYISSIGTNITIGNALELFIDTTNSRVGIGSNSPTKALHVAGDVNITGSLSVNSKNITADFQRFTANGTWTRPAGATIVMIEVIGAGGGGGASVSGVGSGSGGGGGGAFARGIYNAADVPSSLTVTVGAGGTGELHRPATQPGDADRQSAYRSAEPAQ
jgi:hypothetical protein